MTETYSTADIARFLDLPSPRNIIYYIKAGYLNATKINNNYIITKKDFLNFKQEYFIPEQKNKRRGVKTLRKEQVPLLKKILDDLENDSICYQEFLNKYQSLYQLPYYKIFIRYKRNRCIVLGKQFGKKVKDLSKLFNLSEIAIKTILKEEEELELI